MDLSGHEGEIPIPMTNSYVVHGHFNSRPPPTTTPTPTTLSSANNNNTEVQEQQQQAAAAALLSNSNKKIHVVAAATKAVRYRECLKNHAASMGGNATDGCGEFMPSGEEGSLESFQCSACGCHRNFHRKEAEGEPPNSPYLDAYYHLKGRGAYGYMHPRPAAAPPALIMPLGAAAAMHTSESDEVEEAAGYGGGGVGMMVGGGGSVVRKRFRTKFTQEQKEKMLAFAERVGWRLQRQEEGLVQQFCQEVGVKRRVLKVWMHNNKHNYAKKSSSTTTTTTTTTTLHQLPAVMTTAAAAHSTAIAHCIGDGL